MILDEHGEAALAGHLLVRLGTGDLPRVFSVFPCRGLH
jgi:hypothetical protein